MCERCYRHIPQFFSHHRGRASFFLSMSLPLWWQTLILVRLGPLHHIHTLCQYCNPSTATSSVSVTPLLCCNFSSRYTEDLAARRFISITATIGLQVRDIFLFGEEYLSFYEMSIYYSPNGFISAVHCPKVCCLCEVEVYIKEADTPLPISIPSRTFPSPSQSHHYLTYFPRVVPPLWYIPMIPLFPTSLVDIVEYVVYTVCI